MSQTGSKVASASLPLPPQIFLSPTYVKGKEDRQRKGTILGKRFCLLSLLARGTLTQLLQSQEKIKGS